MDGYFNFCKTLKFISIVRFNHTKCCYGYPARQLAITREFGFHWVPYIPGLPPNLAKLNRWLHFHGYKL